MVIVTSRYCRRYIIIHFRPISVYGCLKSKNVLINVSKLLLVHIRVSYYLLVMAQIHDHIKSSNGDWVVQINFQFLQVMFYANSQRTDLLKSGLIQIQMMGLENHSVGWIVLICLEFDSIP